MYLSQHLKPEFSLKLIDPKLTPDFTEFTPAVDAAQLVSLHHGWNRG